MRLQAKISRCLSQMTSMFPCLLLAGCLFPALPTRAADAPAKPGPDVLVFSNGDKLTGKLDHEAGGSVFFASDNAGTVQVPWAKLKELHTEGPFAVIETGSPVGRKKANLDIPIGTISIDGDTLTVTTQHGTQQIPVKSPHSTKTSTRSRASPRASRVPSRQAPAPSIPPRTASASTAGLSCRASFPRSPGCRRGNVLCWTSTATTAR